MTIHMSQSAVHDEALLGQIRRLARKGAYAVALPDGGGAYAVFSPRNAFASPIARLSAAVVARAHAAGLLAEDGARGHLKLSRLGETVMRRHLSAPASAIGPRVRQREMAHVRAVPSADRARPLRVEGPLAWLRRRKDRQGRPLISQVQLEAGERLAADYTRAQMQARVTANWSLTAPCNRAIGVGGGGVEISDGALAARDRLYRAMTVLGPEIGRLLIDVCCHDTGLEAAEKARRWSPRSGKVVLDIGLTLLARHYGMIADARPEARSRVRGWTDDNFTTNLEAWL